MSPSTSVAAGTGVLWGLSYFFWRRLQATPASAWPRTAGC
jgi:hypothetical protein